MNTASDVDIVIARPRFVWITLHNGQTKIVVGSVTRREFNALPGRVKVVRLPDAPIRWEKRINARLIISTEEPPLCP